MTDDETQDAIEYNKKTGFCPNEIKLTQRTVGADEDGVWGPETVNQVAWWQGGAGLASDGKVGPETWAAIKASWELVPACPPGQNIDIGCGLAAYDQSWPGRTPPTALQKSWDQALDEGCTEIRFWSTEWLIPTSLSFGGNKGNYYSGKWLKGLKVPEGVVVGAWIDDPIRDVRTAAYADELKSMHITRAALMINRSNTRLTDVPWALRWTGEELQEVATMFHSRGIECIATCWPQPSRTMIDAMMVDMAWILPLIGSTTFEVDTEGNWKSKFLEGFSSMTEASRYLARRMRELVGEEGTLELTTYTFHTENSKKAILAPLMDRLLPQAYSVRHRGNETVGWNDTLGPGKHQTLAVTRARQAASR